jgi:hypothetical protein
MADDKRPRIEKLIQSIASLEAQQRELGIHFSAQIIELKRRLTDLGGAVNTSSGSIAVGQGATSAGEGGVAAGQSLQGDVLQAGAVKIVMGEQQPVAMTAVQRETALGRYLSHVISHNRYLHLEGIGSGGKLVHIELERIYIILKATRARAVEADEAWLAEEGKLARGERARLGEHGPRTETVAVKVEEALAGHTRMVVLGDPGRGKTTLLRHLALCYARDRAEGSTIVRDRLGLPKSGHLPILLPLRRLGRSRRSRPRLSRYGPISVVIKRQVGT